jgi:tetratricopeptide (TPR) repeat protein
MIHHVRTQSLIWLAALWVGTGCGRTGETPDDLLRRAQADLAAGRLEAASAAIEGVARYRPLDIRGRLLRSQIAAARGKLDEALAALSDPAVKLKGVDGALVEARKGELEIERHHLRTAESALRRALELDPLQIDARRRLIMLYAQQGRSAEIAAHAPALASAPHPQFLDLFFCTLARHQPIDRAEQADVLARAVAADPDDRMSRLALADCLRRLGRLDDAESMLEPLSSSDDRARLIRATIALDRGDVKRAGEVLGPSSGREPDADLERLRGRLALARDDPASAVSHYRMALKAAPTDRETQFGLAQALRLSGRPDEAKPLADAARAQDRLEWLTRGARSPSQRDDPAVLAAIAEACLAVDRRDEARGWYRLALSHDPNNVDLENALTRLGTRARAGP